MIPEGSASALPGLDFAGDARDYAMLSTYFLMPSE